MSGLGVRLGPEWVIGFARNGCSIRPEYALLVKKRLDDTTVGGGMDQWFDEIRHGMDRVPRK